MKALNSKCSALFKLKESELRWNGTVSRISFLKNAISSSDNILLYRKLGLCYSLKFFKIIEYFSTLMLKWKEDF